MASSSTLSLQRPLRQQHYFNIASFYVVLFDPSVPDSPSALFLYTELEVKRDLTLLELTNPKLRQLDREVEARWRVNDQAMGFPFQKITLGGGGPEQRRVFLEQGRASK